MLKKSFPVNLLLLSILVLHLVAACTSMPEGNPQNGERWFRMNRCNGCHGEKGIGGKGVGGKGPAIAGLDISYNKFLHKLRAPNSAIMPAFEEKNLSDQDTADIYLWLQKQTR